MRQSQTPGSTGSPCLSKFPISLSPGKEGRTVAGTGTERRGYQFRGLSRLPDTRKELGWWNLLGGREGQRQLHVSACTEVGTLCPVKSNHGKRGERLGMTNLRLAD